MGDPFVVIVVSKVQCEKPAIECAASGQDLLTGISVEKFSVTKRAPV